MDFFLTSFSLSLSLHKKKQEMSEYVQPWEESGVEFENLYEYDCVATDVNETDPDIEEAIRKGRDESVSFFPLARSKKKRPYLSPF